MARRPARPSGRKAKAATASARRAQASARSRARSRGKTAAKAKPKGSRTRTTPSPRRKAKASAPPKPKASQSPATGRGRGKSPRLERARRLLENGVPTPPSSLDMKRQGSAARTGRREIEERRRQHVNMSPAITAGDVDADLESAYFSGEEAAGGDNPTPDQDIVDDIGKALGVEYHDNEELRASDKIVERDRHRWERNPASSEDYKDRK